MRKEEALSTKGRRRMTQRLGTCRCVFSFPCKSCHLWLSKSFWYEREPLQGEKTGCEPSPNVQTICELFVSVKNSKLIALNPAGPSPLGAALADFLVPYSCTLIWREIQKRGGSSLKCVIHQREPVLVLCFISMYLCISRWLPELVFSLLFCWSLMQSSLSSLQTKKEHLYTWRIELAKTEKYWDGWFRGLSNLFLSCPTPKLLLLAGTCPCQSCCALQWGHTCISEHRLSVGLQWFLGFSVSPKIVCEI